MKRILADTSSLILLYRCGCARLLYALYSTIIPESVFYELTVAGRDGSLFFKDLCSDGILQVINNDGPQPDSPSALHQGERDVIQLYYKGLGDFILIDDRKGAYFCRDRKIPYINSLIALKLFSFAGSLDGQLYGSSRKSLLAYARYSRHIIEWADRAGMEELSFFMP